jgi:hypothetical protein
MVLADVWQAPLARLRIAQGKKNLRGAISGCATSGRREIEGATPIFCAKSPEAIENKEVDDLASQKRWSKNGVKEEKRRKEAARVPFREFWMRISTMFRAECGLAVLQVATVVAQGMPVVDSWRHYCGHADIELLITRLLNRRA